ncbi:hypothetical protein EDB87DRAFT_1239388 [Lactarius vividus]|nr:hypothetical protein EDB87DRAFT_1239388 [Lactarius vividus]
MSQALDNLNATEGDMGTIRGVHLYPPQSAPTQEPRGMSNFVDGSGPFFSMYLEMATEEDKKMAESWKADADGILIFTGLFSAAVASLISVSIQDIRPNPQDTSNFYLANIYRTLANPGANISTSIPTSPPPFSPPGYAVWVNTLLFLSLVISISCALLATLLQQWARRYLKITQPRYSLHKRARIRAFFAEGIDKFFLPWAVEALPTLLHVSLFLFFAGISVFLWNVDLTIFKAVVSWIGICTALYGCITFFPIFRHDSPYNTPLSLPSWHIVAAISLVTFRVFQWFTLSTVFCFPCFCFGPFDLERFAAKAFRRFESLEKRHRRLLLQGMQKTVESTALNSPLEIDTRAFLWTFDSLDEDHELERFFSGLPGFRSSKVVDDPLPHLTEEQKEKLSTGVTGLFDRTCSSDLLPESVKNRRAMICARALDPALFSYEYRRVMDSMMFSNKCMGLQTSKFGCIVRGWGNGGNQGTGEFGVPESVLRGYAANGDSLSLAILIHVIRQQFDHFRKPYWPSFRFLDILEAASKFDVRRTSPELQHKFCALWNQIVRKVQNVDDCRMASWILEPIRNIYVSLHQDTDSAPSRFPAFTRHWDDILDEPSAYPVCDIAGHFHGSTPTTFTRTALHDGTVLVPTSFASADAPSLAIPVSLHVVESLMDVPPRDNFSVHQKTVESLRTSAISPNPATAGTVRDIITSGAAVPQSTLESSISARPFSPTSPPAAVALRQNPEPLMPFGPPNHPSPASSNQVLSILPTGSHRQIIATTDPGTSPGRSFAPDLGAAAEDGGSQKPGLHKDKDAVDPPSVNWAIHANIIAGRSQTGPIPERTGDHPPHPSHHRYDTV